MRTLAYIVGGIGGPGPKPRAFQGGTWFRRKQRDWSLAWHTQTSCSVFDFNKPWYLLQWQPPLTHRIHLHDRAAPKNVRQQQRLLHDLAQRSLQELFVLDGVVPSAVAPTMKALGCPANEVAATLLRLIS